MSTTARTRTVTIRNRLGLHARPAMAFVDTANTYNSEVRVYREDDQTRGNPNGDGVDGKSIMQMMMLAATQGTRLMITAKGDDAEQALEALAELVESGFDED